jgi:hypothetical protein
VRMISRGGAAKHAARHRPGATQPRSGDLPTGSQRRRRTAGPRRLRTGLACALAVLSASVLAGTGASAGSVAAGGPAYDVSWPQCRAQGGVQPMPPASARGVVIGLTNGKPFTRNACLADQAAWAAAKGMWMQTYTMAAYPTAAQLNAYGSAGPWRATTRAGRLHNVGYAEARYALATLSDAGLRSGMVWIDVEALSRQPWPTGTATARAGNRYVVEGLIRGLRDAGRPFGIYANTNAWRTVTGPWWLPGVPAWATVGRAGPAGAQSRCTTTSLHGGPLLLVQWFDTTYDYDLPCAPFSTAPALPPAPQTFGDLDADWAADLLTRQPSTGRLWRYPGNAAAGWRPPRSLGPGWLSMDIVDTVGDLSGDGRPDLLARQRGNGKLWLYPGDGRGSLTARTLLGTGWQTMDAVIGAGDVTGDGIPDVVARDAAAGRLWLYPGNGRGRLRPRTQLGTGWHSMDLLAGGADFTGDGKADLVARERANGRLWLYPGTGAGRWAPRRLVGTGWLSMDALTAVPDLVARQRGTGRLWVYPGNGAGGWLPRINAGTGWRSMDLLA